ncbi:MAG TPA: hypothetical protein VIN73_02330 [Vicingaceae bacterium]
MKNILFILILCSLFFSCKNNNTLTDILNKSEFTNSEKQEIVKMVEFFESKIISSEANFKQDYEAFIKEIYENGYEAILSKIDINEQRKLMKSINNSTFIEIWELSKSRAYMSYVGVKFEEPIPFESLSVNTQGKYVKLLQKLSKSNKKIEHYTNAVLNLGDFPLFQYTYNLLFDYKGDSNGDIRNGELRIIFALELLTINENTHRHISLEE